MTAPLSASVEPRAGRPTLLINGQPHAPLLYALSDCPGARWTWEEVPARNLALFAAHGVRLFQVDLWLEQLLTADGSLDLALARRQVGGVLAACPGAAVMIRLHVRPPLEWCRQHPAECVGYADTAPHEPEPWGLRRPLDNDGGRPLRASFASVAWRQWAEARLREFCTRFADTPEGRAVFSLQLANGLYGEWHQFGFMHHDPDTGEAATRAFRDWLRERYGDDAELARAWGRPGLRLDEVRPPDTPARETAPCGPLRNPRTQRDIIDYFTWLHLAATDALLALAATVRKAWPRPVVIAAFHGYFYGQFGRHAAGSHLALDRALASPHLDCLCSPQSYSEGTRAMGGSGHARGLVGAVRRAGKLWLDENDHGTSLTGCPWDRSFRSNLDDDVAYLRRNSLQSALRGGGQWWYDFGMVAGTPSFADHGNVGWWDHPRLIREIGAIHDLVQARVGRPFRRPADVLVLHDPWSYCHTVARRIPLEGFAFGDQPPAGPNPFSTRGADGLLEGLYHSGLVADEALLSELPGLDLTPYRLVFLGTTPVLDAHQRAGLADRVARDGRTIVLTGFAGWGDGAQVGPDLAVALAGLPVRLETAGGGESRLALDGAAEIQSLDPALAVPAFDAPPDRVAGRWANGAASAAWHTTPEATWWSFALAPVAPAVLRALGCRAGCHVVNDHDDVTLLGDGLLLVHTVAGGPRKLRLPGGPTREVELPPRSTTVLDAETGATLLG